jgi:hypothetical protein
MADVKSIEAARDLVVALLGSEEGAKRLTSLYHENAKDSGTSLGEMFTALVNAIDGVMFTDKRT